MLKYQSPAPKEGAFATTKPSTQDNAAPLNFMHYHLETSPNDTLITKRDPQRLMNRCTATGMRGWVFMDSYCDEIRNLQAVRVFCHDPDDRQMHDLILQSCDSDEFCVNTGLSPIGGRAYCVNIQNYEKVRRVRGRQLKTVTIPNAGRVQSANALLADGDRRHGLQDAYSFELDALQLTGDISKRVLSDTLVLKRVQCRGCSSLSMQQPPTRTDGFRASIDITHAEEGYVFLTTIS